MSPGQTGHVTGQMGRVPGTDGTHTRGCPAKILYVYFFPHVYMYFPSVSLEHKLFGIHQTSFLLAEALEFSEPKTPLVYTFFPSNQGPSQKTISNPPRLG